MRLILREEVDNLGKRGQVVNVSRGFARNYLLPQRLAMEVSDNNLRLIEKEKKVYEVKLAKEKEEAEVVAQALSAVKLIFRRKVKGDGQDLYGSVSLADLAEALEAKGFGLEKRKILLHEPLKL
ncbi:MAG: 50S ribosomal protein L9, partial [Vicinamibacteria bacterium]